MKEGQYGTFDVVVPVYKPDRKLKELLAMLERQRKRPEKIVLMVTVDGPEKSGEDWAFDCRIPTEVHYLQKEEFDHGGTRNRGIGFCESEVVVCMTQDAVPEDEYMTEELLRPFFGSFCGGKQGRAGDREILISYGRQLPREDCRFIERYTRSFNYPEESRLKTAEDIPGLGIKTFFASNVCAAYRREFFWKQGGFPERTIFNEDMIFAGRAVKAGYAIAYAAEARVVHSHNLSGAAQFHRNFDLAVSQAQFPDVFGGIRSEGEGIRLVKSTMAYLWKKGKFYLIPSLIWGSGCKYMGYLLGKRYQKLPKRIVRACSMNKRYWRKQ